MIQERSFLKFFLLSFITCGIYSIVFMYYFTEDLNVVCAGHGKESPNYLVVFLLSLVTCGIYGIIWYYNQSNRMQDAGYAYGVNIKEGGTTVLLWLLIGMVIGGLGYWIVNYFMINNMNQLAECYNSRNGGNMGNGNAY